MKKFMFALLLVVLSPIAFAEVGIITYLDPAVKSVTIVEGAGEPRIYYISERQRLRMKSDASFDRVQAGNEVSFSYRATNEGRELTSFSVANPDAVKDTVPYISREPKSFSGEIVGKRPAEMALILRQEDRSRRTFRVGKDAVIKKGDRTIRFNELKRGDLITARYHQTAEGAFLFSSNRAPAVVTAPAEPVQVTMALPEALPTTATGYPLLALLGVLAGVGAVGITLARRASGRVS